MTIPNLEENWEAVKNLLPVNWQELARSKGAFKRKFRNFSSIDDILRILLMHTVQGFLLRETVARAKMANLVSLSDVALLKCLKKSEK